MTQKPTTPTDTTPAVNIVSSAHLASPESMALSEFEFGLIIASNAFSRWVVRCMAAAGLPDLTYTDALVLHHINHRARGKKLADICFTLNYEDTHVVNYALKKLLALKLVATDKQGKEVYYSTNEAGQAVIVRYRAIREQCLVHSIGSEHNQDIAKLAGLIRNLSGQYDQAARAATSL
jgi:predicted MarR family transcription regulator